MRILYLVVCLLLVLGCLVSVADAQTLRKVALSGDAAPVTDNDANFSGFGVPVLNDSGQTAFLGFLTGTGVSSSNSFGIWSEGGGAGLALVVRRGDAAPGTGGASFSYFGPGLPVLNDAGQTAFYATLASSNSFGIWSEGGGAGLALVARERNVAPETGGASFSYLERGQPVFNNAGQMAFLGSLIGTGVNFYNDRGIWSEGGGTGLALVARAGNIAPDTGGANFAPNQNFSTPVLNDAGQTVFFARLIGTEVSSDNDVGIWSEGGGTGLALVARDGDVAPGTSGAEFSFGGFSFGTPVLNGAGQTAFAGFLHGTGVSSSNGSGIWSEGGGAGLALVARTGDVAPETGGAAYFTNLGNATPVLNDVGQTAFSGRLTGTGVSLSNDSGIWSEGGGTGLGLVALEGNAAPEAGGSNFGDFSNSTPVLNGAGKTAFFGRLTGAGVDNDNDRGIWAEDRLGVLKLIAREGDLLDVDDGPDIEFRIISGLSFAGDTGNGDSRSSGFNSLGQLAFFAEFTDGSSGVFISNLAAIPEPATWVLAAFAASGLFVRRRCVRGQTKAGKCVSLAL